MAGIARQGDSVGGGTIIATAANTKANGLAVARIGDAVTSHGIGPHANAVMVGGSTAVKAEGIGVCRLGDAASCGDVVTTASSTVNAN